MIDAAARARLLERSPYNAVAIDLPKPFDPADRTGSSDEDPYAEAAGRSPPGARPAPWSRTAEPSIWALTQDYTAPDGSGHSRHGILARVRVEDYESGGDPPP